MKWSYRLHQIERIPEMTRRAIKVAMSPPGGPTFLQMNEDLYGQESTGKIIPQKKFSVSSSVRPQPELITEAAKLLKRLRAKMQSAAHDVPVKLREQATYRLALCEFELDRFGTAAEVLEAFLRGFPARTLMASASFYAGEALFPLGRHCQAVVHHHSGVPPFS